MFLLLRIILPSVFPTGHSLRTRTQVRDKCTQVHDQNQSSKFAKSVPFRADKPFLSEKNRYKSEFTVVSLVANRRASMHAFSSHNEMIEDLTVGDPAALIPAVLARIEEPSPAKTELDARASRSCLF